MAAIGPDALVVKVGGAELPRVAALLRELRTLDRPRVLVHGGGAEITRRLAQLGEESVFLAGRRVTSPAAAEVARQALMDLQEELLVLAREVGLAPVSGQELFHLRPVSDRRLGAVGEVCEVDVAGFQRLFLERRLVVVAPNGPSPDGGYLNINADDLAGALAGALGADLLLFTDVPAVRGTTGPLSRIDLRLAQSLIADGHVTGGMVAKIEAALAALQSGAQRAWLGRMADESPIARSVAGGTWLEV